MEEASVRVTRLARELRRAEAMKLRERGLDPYEALALVVFPSRRLEEISEALVVARLRAQALKRRTRGHLPVSPRFARPSHRSQTGRS